jgi:predicted dehydrogenase
MPDESIPRRAILTSAAAAFTTNLFTGRVKGANDRVAVGFIGLGAMGSGNLGYSMKVPEIQPAALCDIYQPHLERAQAAARKGGYEPKTVTDFRDIIADKSLDAVCISTPDHWHAYMTVEACKAGKDVYVEKPSCVYIDEGPKMVAAARKYKRIVQAGTMQRSGGYFKKASELVHSGILGEITFCHAYQSGLTKKAGYGNPPDGEPIPAGLDWNMWLGPAPEVPFNANRWGVKAATFPTFRYFWDYAGGAMTDWGVHLIDPLHQCFDEVMPTAITALGDKYYVTDNVQTPDTMLATYHYPKFLTTYESRTANQIPLFGLDQTAASMVGGTEASVLVSRGGCWLIPNKGSKMEAQTYTNDNAMRDMNVPHWKNWIACVKSREKPISEIETCVRSSAVCLLGNIALRSRSLLDWDEKNWTVKQDAAKPFLQSHYRAPWKLEV